MSRWGWLVVALCACDDGGGVGGSGGAAGGAGGVSGGSGGSGGSSGGAGGGGGGSGGGSGGSSGAGGGSGGGAGGAGGGAGGAGGGAGGAGGGSGGAGGGAGGAGGSGGAGGVHGECPDFDSERRPFFGDLHVHTSYSFDSYGLRNTRSSPREAYQFARGEAISIPPYEDDASTRPPVQLSRPLDFAAVTDHSEFLGEVSLCIDPESAAYDTASCRNFRTSSDFEARVGTDVAFLGWGAGLATGSRPPFCDRPGVDCPAAGGDAWERTQQITEAANSPCTFSALHGYEYTGQVGVSMNHRNVIFRNATVPARPVSYFDAREWEALARALVRECNDAGTGCEALAIPHNPNYSNGVQFRPTDGAGEPLTAETARLRQEMEPVVEMIQTKQESECRNGFERYAGAADELCGFEKRDFRTPICAAGQTPCGMGETPEDDGCTDCLLECAPGEEGQGGCIAAHDYVRNALKVGLEQLAAVGVNPFRLGFIGSTDTHNATPGRVDEQDFEGHHGFQDDELDDRLTESAVNVMAVEPSPGGLAVVWAGENTRDAIFQGLKRRETYATSGPRMIVRFFGGADLPVDLCDQPDFVARGYAAGVPMGALLPAGGPPRFALRAQRDPEGAGLQRIQVVKVWLDAGGAPQEQVFDVTPELDTSATVDLATCQPRGPARDELCAVWTDEAFDPTRPAAWYARVVEVPTCRWNQWTCLREAVDCGGPNPPEGCCDPDVPKTTQDRAYTSPIFHEP